MSEIEEIKTYCADFEPYNDTGGTGRCLRFNQRCFTWVAEYQPRKCYPEKVVLGHWGHYCPEHKKEGGGERE